MNASSSVLRQRQVTRIMRRQVNRTRLGNPDRNQKIYTLWKSGLTIDEISAQLNIPRSTAGYYVHLHLAWEIFSKCDE